MVRLFIFAGLLFLFSTLCKTKERLLFNEKLDRINIDLLLKKEICKTNTPAIALAVFNVDTIITFSHGIKGINNNLPINDNDKYNIGSCTKAITSLLAACIIKKGEISYSTTIAEIFEDFKDDIHPYYHDKTLQDLLSHKAGVRSFVAIHDFEMVPQEISNCPQQDKRKKFVEWVLGLSPSHSVNGDFNYSNAGYTVAAAMLEKVENKTWENLIQDEVFTPLGVKAWFGWPHVYSDIQTKGHLNLFEYDKTKENKLIQFPDSSDYRVMYIEPAGNLTLTIKEHAVVMQEILKGIKGKGKLLTKSDYESLLSSYETYINGWYHFLSEDRCYWWHEGSNGPFYAQCRLCENYNYGLVVLSNAGDKETIMGIRNLIKHIDDMLTE